MTFQKDGFLSSDLHIFISHSRNQFGAWFELIDALNKDIFPVLLNVKPRTDNKQQFTAALLFSRTAQSFQAAILLAERGLISESRTLVRSCLETAIVLAMVAKDGDFVEKIVEAHNKHYLSLINAMSADQKVMSALPPDTAEQFRKIKEDITSRYPSGPRDYNLEAVAIKVGLGSLYTAIFRSTSGDAAHATIGAMLQHTWQDEAGEIEDLRFEPTTTDLDVTLSNAVSCLLHALEPMYKIFLVLEFKTIFNVYMAKWRALENMPL
jgi:hypothetical protein